MKRALIVSNCPLVGSGYGMQTTHLIKMLQEQGCKVAVLAAELPKIPSCQGRPVRFHIDRLVDLFTRSGVSFIDSRTDINNYEIYLGDRLDGGWDMLKESIKDFGADFVITLIDIWSCPYELAHDLPDVPYFCWVPLDQQPTAPGNVQSLQYIGESHKLHIIAMGETGRADLSRFFSNVQAIPHCVDLKKFKRRPNKAQVRKEMGFPEEGFIVGMVAQNRGFPSRKAFDQQFQAFKYFYEMVKAINEEDAKKVYFYMHTNPKEAGGIDLNYLQGMYEIPDANMIWYRDRKYFCHTVDEMCNIYNCIDVLLNCSCAEGFGIPILEAQACGCPAITSKFANMPEITFYGKAIEPMGRSYCSLGSFWCIPDPNAIAKELFNIYTQIKKSGVPIDEIRKTRDHIRDNYSVQIVKQKWLDLLTKSGVF